MRYILLEFDWSQRRLVRLEDFGDDRDRASVARLEAQLAADDRLDREIVVLIAEGIEGLHRTHASYFMRPELIAANFAGTLHPAVDESSPEVATDTLNRLPGADARAELGRSQGRSGNTIPLEQLKGRGSGE